MYIIINQHLEKYDFLSDKTKTVHFLSGALAGSFATVASFPLDTVRTRLIAQSSQHRAYKGTLHSCTQVVLSNSSVD